MIILRHLTLLLICCLFLACQNQEDINRPPQFLWPAFERFWSKNATEYVQLDGIYQVENAYVVDYGHGVVLTIPMQDNIVTGAEVSFPETVRNYAGGQQFLRLIEHIMHVGVFRWTAQEIKTMKNFFGPMGPTKKELSFRNSHFTRQREDKLWTFKLQFIPNTLVMTSIPPLNENQSNLN